MTEYKDPEGMQSAADYVNGSPEYRRTHDYYVLHKEELPQKSDDPWQVFTLANAYQERPPTRYVASSLFRIPSVNIVYGPPGALKSLLMADLACCVAGGIPWLQPASWQSSTGTGFYTEQGPAMYLDFDNGADMDHERFEALGKAYGLAEDTPLYYFSMPEPWLNAADKASIGGLILRVQKYSAKLIIIDNLGVVSGGADENSGDMIPVMSLMRQLAENTNAAVVLIHHQRKSTGYNSRAGDTLRGHGSIEAAINLAMLVEREEHSNTLTIKATKVRGPDILPFGAEFTFDKKDNGDLAAARFYGIEVEDTASDAAIGREVLAALEGVAMNKTELSATVKNKLQDIGVNRIRGTIERMAADGKINQRAGKRSSERIYSLL